MISKFLIKVIVCCKCIFQIPLTASKPKSHRFSAKYRSDILRATGFKATTVPAYLPTVPTVTPVISVSPSLLSPMINPKVKYINIDQFVQNEKPIIYIHEISYL